MNIMDYRALKAQEVSQNADQTLQNTPTTPQTQPTPPVVQKQTQTPSTVQNEIKTPEKIKIDGIGEITLEELKNGYLRQSDYTQKTQEVAKQRKEAKEAIELYENIKLNPQVAEQIKKATPLPSSVDPATAKVVELENRVYDMMLNNEISELQRKYPDFEVREVLETAQKKQLTNLEDAYILTKSVKSTSTDVESLKKQIRQEILNELKNDKTATQTIITGNDGGVIIQDNTPKLSEVEKKVARNMHMSELDYVKWRDIGTNKKK